MKKTLLFLFLCFFAVSLQAQRKKKTNKLPKNLPYHAQCSHVYFKDGSRIKGLILEENDQVIKLEIAGDHQFSFRKDNIKKIKNPTDLYHLTSKGRYAKKQGEFLSFKLTNSFTSNPNYDFTPAPDFNFDVAFNYFFKKKMSIGAGTGLNFYNPLDSRRYTFIPVYAHFKLYPIEGGGVAPYASLSAGYSFPSNWRASFGESDSFSGGPFVNPSIGIQLASKTRTKFTCGMGYRFQYTEALYLKYPPSIFSPNGYIQEPALVRETWYFNRFEIFIGFTI